MDRQGYIRVANLEQFTEITGPRTGKSYKVRDFVYGVLVPDHDHPLSTVSVSNNSLSIDLWTGCAYQCAYCHVQGTLEDLDAAGAMRKRPILRSKFSIDEIIDALIEHPFFSKNETIISIGTASTEPFAPGVVTDSTFEIMRAFVARGLKNPFWIVTKAGVPKGCKQTLAEIVLSNRLLISICWADNPSAIEPSRSNRFLYSRDAKEAGASVSWYLRPIVPEWSGTRERIDMMMIWVAERYSDVIDSIVPGGLRWTEGIEYGLTEINSVPMPEIPRDDNVKSLPESWRTHIFELGKKLFPGTPVYNHSSCALTYMLGIPSITAVQFSKMVDCNDSICTSAQRQCCVSMKQRYFDLRRIQLILDELGIPIVATGFSESNLLTTEPPFESLSYTLRQTIVKALARVGNS